MADRSEFERPNPSPKPNQNSITNSTNPKKKKKKKKTEFEFCKVCNRNHDEGQRHKYFPSHTTSLSSFLSKFQTRITEVRFFLNNPTKLRLDHASSSRFWCVVCDSDIDELRGSFACNNAIKHLAGVDHLKNLKHFLWKYGGGMERVDAFRILEADLAKWEKKCKSLKSEAASSGEGAWGLLLGPSNDIHNELNTNDIHNELDFEKNTVYPLNSNISNGVIPLQYYTNEYQVLRSGQSGVANTGSNVDVVTASSPAHASGSNFWNSNDLMVNRNSLCNGTNCSGDVYSSKKGMYQVTQEERMVNRDISFQGLQNITQISSMDPQEAGGNVHSGAPPPWLEATEGDKLKPVLSGFVSSSKKSGKSKLNPKRVGAAWAEKRKMEMEMEKRGEIVKKDCDSNWLPDFGRVWQSGTRKESRREFEIEKQKQLKAQNPAEMPMRIQPYISKRMRRDVSEDSTDPCVND